MTRKPKISPRSAIAGVAVLAAAMTGLTACGGSSGPSLALSAALPQKTPKGTVIRIGDPTAQVAFALSGLDKQLAANGVKVQWANISGGPESIQAFRGNKLDCSAVADIPSLFAHWTGTDTQVVFESVTKDPLQNPTYKLGIAPGEHITSLADLKGKKIAYSPGQAQGALVLRILQKAGLTQKDVTLVDLPSTASTYATALGSKAVDAAPLGTSTLAASYLSQYKGGSEIYTGIRDDASTVYCLTSAVKDPAKAAALREYVALRTKAVLWENTHLDEWKTEYYEKNQGLSAAEADVAIKARGIDLIPANWNNAITRMQQTADLLAKEQDHPKFDVNTIVDKRFAAVEAAAAGSQVVTGDAS